VDRVFGDMPETARKELADVYRAVPDLIEAQTRGRQQIGRTKALAREISVDPDDILPACYIEYWGLEGAEYQRRRVEKMRIYRAHKLNLIELTEADVTKLDDVLPQRLRQFGVSARYLCAPRRQVRGTIIPGSSSGRSATELPPGTSLLFLWPA
jgi:hypothetical protein